MEGKSTGGQDGKLPNLRAKQMLNAKMCDGCVSTQLSQTDPVLFLPTLPARRTKPIWMTDVPSFHLPGQGELPPDKPVPLHQWYNPVDFVLRRSGDAKKELTPAMKELNVIPQPWHGSVIANKKRIIKGLRVVSPCITQAIEIWFNEFVGSHFVNCSEIRGKSEAMELEAFVNLCCESISREREKLSKQWLMRLQFMLTNDRNRKFLPPLTRPHLFEGFFLTLMTAMTLNLQQMAMESLEAYTRDNVLTEPDKDKFSKALSNVLDEIIKVAQAIPRLERRMYPELDVNPKHLKPVVLDEFVEPLRQIIMDAVEEEFQPVLTFMETFSNFDFLISNKAKEEINEYLMSQQPFDDMVKKFTWYQDLKQTIEFSLPRCVTIGMFELRCHSLIDTLLERAQDICEGLVDHMMEFHQEKNKTITFLCDYADFSHAILRSNSQPFQLYLKMDDVMTENAIIMNEKQKELIDRLKTNKAKFVALLEEYTRQVEELDTFADVNQVESYDKIAIALQENLINAADQVAAFNEEEESFGFELSQYPQRMAAINKMKPYFSLFRECAQFNENYNNWMFGPMEAVIPDDVDASVGASYRAILKLEKTFAKRPCAENIAKTFRGKVEKFKENLPLMNVLCNPGLRPRHWEAISDIAK
ncbi:hypothetical protein PoB_003155900 [Plakobranchus ocellatus]|uniref:Dynein heavy chain linker domain-containing protein n=1 Tax=Plakobranchus ocellatus TaxID=259542 RepID=A0AAV4AFL7_9GAST|nr:hypothetical protein PoB_003155900 [Plakobranchus ocellatus]